MEAPDDLGVPSVTRSANNPVTSSKLQLPVNSQNQNERIPRTIHGEMDSYDPTSNLLEHNIFVNRDILPPIQNVSQSPKIVHYHLTIQNCDGVEICVDNRKQNFTQKTAYSADGQRLKRLSWIEVPSNPIDVGPSLHNTRSIATTENNHIVPNNDEEMVFISPEAEELFCHNDQVIIQESSRVPHRTETPSQIDAGMQSSMASTMVNTDGEETPMPVLTNGSSQTDTPNQQSQYTQTAIPGFANRARQAAARRTATSPFRRNHPRETAMLDSHIGSRTTCDLNRFPINQNSNRRMVSQQNPHRERVRRSRSAERENSYGQKGIAVDTSSTAASAHSSQRRYPNSHSSSHPLGQYTFQSLNM